MARKDNECGQDMCSHFCVIIFVLLFLHPDISLQNTNAVVSETCHINHQLESSRIQHNFFPEGAVE